MYDVIVIGGGPAGMTAAATLINLRMETLLIAEKWGGQTAYDMQLEEMEDREIITGESLLDAFRRQLSYLDFVRHFDCVTKLTPQEQHFMVYTARGDCFESRALILATGAKPERLNVPGEAELTGRGLSYSAETHAGLFLGKDVAVIGQGRRAQWATADLARKAHRVYMLTLEEPPETPLMSKLRQMEQVEIIEQVTIEEILGKQFVEGVAFKTAAGERREIAVKGVFSKLARTPNVELVRDWIDCDSEGHVIVDVYCATSWSGVFAAGDVTHISEQVLVHIGEGAKAAMSASHHVLMR